MKKIWKQLKKEPALLITIVVGVAVLLYVIYKSNSGKDTGMGYGMLDNTATNQRSQQPYELQLFSITPPAPPSQTANQPGKHEEDEHHHPGTGGGHHPPSPKPKPHPKPHPKPKPGPSPHPKPGPSPHPKPILVSPPVKPIGPLPPVKPPHTPMHSSQETGQTGTGSNGHKIVAQPPHIKVVPPVRNVPQGNLKQPIKGKLISPPVKGISSGSPSRFIPGTIFAGPTGVYHIISNGRWNLQDYANYVGSGTWNSIYGIPDNQKAFGKLDSTHASALKPKRGATIVIPKPKFITLKPGQHRNGNPGTS